MTALDDLPTVDSFMGIDLKTGSMIIAAIGVECAQFLEDTEIVVYAGEVAGNSKFYVLVLYKTKVHPMAYGCSFFLPMSYLLVSIWILVALYFAASIVLFVGIVKDDVLLCSIWLWYALIFVVVMVMMMMVLALLFTSRKQKPRVIVVILAILWYILTVYFIIVVNSHRKEISITEKDDI